MQCDFILYFILNLTALFLHKASPSTVLWVVQSLLNFLHPFLFVGLLVYMTLNICFILLICGIFHYSLMIQHPQFFFSLTGSWPLHPLQLCFSSLLLNFCLSSGLDTVFSIHLLLNSLLLPPKAPLSWLKTNSLQLYSKDIFP